ncbi:hypothetical protein HYR99_35325, partial [Candidatus Poribacteria bacterium]|nr:hypothetical protein [Candidatus Poribacteria bacterium]
MPQTRSGFQLPPDVSVRKERLSGSWVYVFRHTQLGDLGRIVLSGRPDGRTHVICEVAGERADPTTEKQAAIFKPLGTELARQLDIATGGTGEEKWVSPPPRLTELPKKRVATKLM